MYIYNEKVNGYRVIEDNGGGLALTVMDENGMVFYHHTGYEYYDGSLIADIKALENGDNPSEWEGNEIEGDPIDFWDLYEQLDCGCSVIVADGCIFWYKMGSAGRREFRDWKIKVKETYNEDN